MDDNHFLYGGVQVLGLYHIEGYWVWLEVV